MNPRIGRGSEPGKANDGYNPSVDDRREASFRRSEAIMCPGDADISFVVDDNKSHGKEVSCHDAKESETFLACVPPIALLEDNRIGAKAEI